MEAINWDKLTRPQAIRLQRAASREEQRHATAYGSGDDASEAPMMAAYTLWEHLQVWLITGQTPDMEAA